MDDKIYNYSSRLASLYLRLEALQNLNNFFSECRNHTNGGRLEVTLYPGDQEYSDYMPTIKEPKESYVAKAKIDITTERAEAFQLQFVREEQNINDEIRKTVKALKHDMEIF